MIEEFTIPRWAKLLTRLAGRRFRQTFKHRRTPRRIETIADIQAALNEPFWDPVVELVDPWRRSTAISFDASPTPAEAAGWVEPSVAPLPPMSATSSDLATRLTPSSVTTSPNAA